MARIAGLGEARRYVVRIRDGLVFGGVTAIAIGRRPREYIVHVARQAWRGGVGASERESRIGVVKRGTVPGRGVVAD